MSDTPRTDEISFSPDLLRLSKTVGIPVEVVPADFARQLERENAELRKQLLEKEEAAVYWEGLYRGGSEDAKSPEDVWADKISELRERK